MQPVMGSWAVALLLPLVLVLGAGLGPDLPLRTLGVLRIPQRGILGVESSLMSWE